MTRADGVYQRLMAARSRPARSTTSPTVWRHPEVEAGRARRVTPACARHVAPGHARPRAHTLTRTAPGVTSTAASQRRVGGVGLAGTAAVRSATVWGRLFGWCGRGGGRPRWSSPSGRCTPSPRSVLGVVSALLVGQVVDRRRPDARGSGPWPLLVPVTAVLRWLDSFVSHDLAYRLLAELRIRLYQLLDPLAPAYLVRRRTRRPGQRRCSATSS